MNTVGISVLMADTGEKARALQHWSDIGILRAEPDTDKKGRGRYREYVAEPYFGERKWALVASALNELRIPLGEIRSIVDNLRAFGGPNFEEAEKSKQIAINKFRVSFFYKALAGDGDVIVLIGQSMVDGRACIDHCFLPAIGDATLRPRRIQSASGPLNSHSG